MAAQIISFPARLSQTPRSTPTPGEALPFVDRTNPGSNWRVPPTSDYTEACRIGGEYAAQYLQHLKDDPSQVGTNLLGRIAADIDFKDSTAAKGYWVGFFTYLEKLLHAQASRMDVFGDLSQRQARHAEFLDLCQTEGA